MLLLHPKEFRPLNGREGKGEAKAEDDNVTLSDQLAFATRMNEEKRLPVISKTVSALSCPPQQPQREMRMLV